MVRPFYPGGDYEHEAYPAGCCVVDNPPFSILAQIVDFYIEKRIPFFLFCQSLTGASVNGPRPGVCLIPGLSIVYENGARIQTGFLTSLEGNNIVRIAPDLRRALAETTGYKNANSFIYPDEALTMRDVLYLGRWSEENLSLAASGAVYVRSLDSQVDQGTKLFSGGWLLSTAQSRQKTEALKKVEDALDLRQIRFALSDRERAIIAALDAGEVPANE